MGELEFISGRRGASGEEIVKSTLFCKVHYVLYSDIKYTCLFLIASKHLLKIMPYQSIVDFNVLKRRFIPTVPNCVNPSLR
jgi:hypothetical protein